MICNMINIINTCSCSVAESRLTFCNPTACSTPGFRCPSLSPGICSNSCPLNQWCHLTISSSVTPFFLCLQSFLASESFPMSQLINTFSERAVLKNSLENFIDMFLLIKRNTSCWNYFTSSMIGRFLCAFSNTFCQTAIFNLMVEKPKFPPFPLCFRISPQIKEANRSYLKNISY